MPCKSVKTYSFFIRVGGGGRGGWLAKRAGAYLLVFYKIENKKTTNLDSFLKLEKRLSN